MPAIRQAGRAADPGRGRHPHDPARSAGKAGGLAADPAVVVMADRTPASLDGKVGTATGFAGWTQAISTGGATAYSRSTARTTAAAK